MSFCELPVRRLLIGVALISALTGCVTALSTGELEETGTVQQVDLDLPYHPLVYHLDLSILAYQLYGQSLVWPFDPYYEEMGGKRKATIDKVKAWAARTGKIQQKQPLGIKGYRGPGILNGFDDNPTHDPIIYRYSQINPDADTLTNAAGTWTEYLTPKSITAKIGAVEVCYRPAGRSGQHVSLDKVARPSAAGRSSRTDTLLAFEGGTGDKGEPNRPPSQSLMGFVLVRKKPADGYDLHIAFRGSRSGSAGRAVIEALSDNEAKGNPDWITDLGYNRLTSGQGGAHISTVGTVHRGFAQSMNSIFPALFKCLQTARKRMGAAAPDTIYVTGHSLGGALAQMLVAAVLEGNRYGPSGKGRAMPKELHSWPWTEVKLITYGAPRVGDETFARNMTVNRLQSEFFSTEFNPIDTKALRPNDPQILPRLVDKGRPASFRVLHSKDPITTEKVAGGKHIGKTVYVNRPGPLDALPPPDFSAHEQRKIRDGMVKSIGRNNIPELAIRYRKMKDIVPQRNGRKKGSAAEQQKLADGLKRYYRSNSIPFDFETFDREFQVRSRIDNEAATGAAN